jgi:hypothetical protein
MKRQVTEGCGAILGNPSLVPQRVAQAATRLMHSFGERDFAGIDHRDFDRYLEAATCGPRAHNWKLGGASEIACYDIYILGTLALWQGQPAFHARVEDWLRPHMELVGRMSS